MAAGNKNIFINIDVSSKKAEVSSNKLSKSFGVLANQTNKINKEQASLRGEQKLATAQQKKLNYEMQNAGKIAAVYEMSTKKAGAGTKQFRTQVGLNNAILQEAGRAASDLRFGFNGVANNVGQLASLFGSLINTSDNVFTSLTNLGKSLLGTGGILIAVQLLIAYGDQIYAFFFETDAAARKLKSTMEDLVKPINENRLELLGYMDVLKDTTSSEEARLEALNKLGEAVPDAVDDNGNLKVSYDELKSSVEDYIDQLLIRAEVEAIIDINSDRFNRRRKLRAIDDIKDASERTKAIKEFIEEESNFYDSVFTPSELEAARSMVLKDAAENDVRTEEEKNKALLKGLKQLEKDRNSVSNERIRLQGQAEYQFSKEKEEQIEQDFQTLKKASEIEAAAIIKSVTELQKKLKGLNKTNGGLGSESELKIFREGSLQLEKLEESYRRKSIDKDLLTEEEKIENKRKFNIKDLELTLKNFEEKELIRLNTYVKQIKERKLSSEKEQQLIDQANLAFIKSIEKSEEDAAKVKVQINSAANQSLEDLSDERRDRAIDNISEIREEERKLSIVKQDLAMQESFLDEGYFGRLEFSRKEIDLIIKQTEAEDARLNDLKDGNDREIALYEEKLSLVEKGSSKEALLLESLSSLKLTSLDLEDDITKNSFKNSSARIKIAKAEANAKVQSFKVTGDALNAFSKLVGEDTKAGKAMAVAGALISTYSSAQKAFESQFMPIPTASSPVRGVVAAAGAVANGLANVKAILSVDPKGESAVKAVQNVQAPAFNVVGASSTDQLAQAVSGKINEPLKAYVVGKEITNQQELDRNTISTAGL